MQVTLLSLRQTYYCIMCLKSVLGLYLADFSPPGGIKVIRL